MSEQYGRNPINLSTFYSHMHFRRITLEDSRAELIGEVLQKISAPGQCGVQEPGNGNEIDVSGRVFDASGLLFNCF
jgi:hypothetical protein